MNNNYFSTASVFTDTANFRSILENLPSDIESICQFTQNLLIHAYWFERYGCDFDEATQFKEMQLRYISDIFERAESKGEKDLTSPRKAQNRIVSICRDFSLMLCSILRAKGIPARLRCGFATYLRSNHFEDHWICEFWSERKSKWVMADAQLDSLHRDTLKIDFDPCDFPQDKFILAGKAWEICRSDKENPELFGINGFSGLAFIKGNVIRDLFALTKIELLAWDTGWGILQEYITPIADENELSLMDELAVHSSLSDVPAANEAIESCKQITLPDDWGWFKSPSIKDLYSKHREYT